MHDTGIPTNLQYRTKNTCHSFCFTVSKTVENKLHNNYQFRIVFFNRIFIIVKMYVLLWYNEDEM